MSHQRISAPVPGRCEVILVRGPKVAYLKVQAPKYVRLVSALVCVATSTIGFIYFITWNVHVFPYLWIAAAISMTLWLGHASCELDAKILVSAIPDPFERPS